MAKARDWFKERFRKPKKFVPTQVPGFKSSPLEDQIEKSKDRVRTHEEKIMSLQDSIGEQLQEQFENSPEFAAFEDSLIEQQMEQQAAFEEWEKLSPLEQQEATLAGERKRLAVEKERLASLELRKRRKDRANSVSTATDATRKARDEAVGLLRAKTAWAATAVAGAALSIIVAKDLGVQPIYFARQALLFSGIAVAIAAGFQVISMIGNSIALGSGWLLTQANTESKAERFWGAIAVSTRRIIGVLPYILVLAELAATAWGGWNVSLLIGELAIPESVTGSNTTASAQ